MDDHLLAGLEPLLREQREALWSVYADDAPAYVSASNAIEGNTLTCEQTTWILRTGLTIGGKTVREHIEAVNGNVAYFKMLGHANAGDVLTEDTVKALHRKVVGEDWGGRYKDHQNYIRGAMHVPVSPRETPAAMHAALDAYAQAVRSPAIHPVAAAATLHWNITHIHPFIDGNGRTARLVSDLALLLVGYAPVAIEIGDKAAYFAVLERSSMGGEPGVGDPRAVIEFFTALEARALQRDRQRALQTMIAAGKSSGDGPLLEDVSVEEIAARGRERLAKGRDS